MFHGPGPNSTCWKHRGTAEVAAFHEGAFTGCLSSTLCWIESVGGHQRWREKLFGNEVETFAEGNLTERGRCSNVARTCKRYKRQYTNICFAVCSMSFMFEDGTCHEMSKTSNLGRIYLPTLPGLLFCT